MPKTLLRLGLHALFVDLIMTCVTTVTYSFMMNGIQFGLLQPGRGIRQGNPLLPYLFICVVEAFLGPISQAERRGDIRNLEVARQALVIPSLCFGRHLTLLSSNRGGGE